MMTGLAPLLMSRRVNDTRSNALPKTDCVANAQWEFFICGGDGCAMIADYKII